MKNKNINRLNHLCRKLTKEVKREKYVGEMYELINEIQGTVDSMLLEIMAKDGLTLTDSLACRKA